MTKPRPKYSITGWINSPVRRQKNTAGCQSKGTESKSRWQKQLRIGTPGRGTRYKKLWMPTSAVKFYSHHAVIRVYDEAGSVVEAHERRLTWRPSLVRTRQ